MVNVMTIANRTTNEPNAMRNHFPNRLISLFSFESRKEYQGYKLGRWGLQ